MHRQSYGVIGALALMLGAAAPLRAETAAVVETLPAQGIHYLGWSRFHYNDLIGDGHDRWQTGGLSLSVLAGADWTGRAPVAPFSLWEFRLGGSVIAPQSLEHPAADDRRYVSRTELSARSYFEQAGWQAMVGFGVVGIGPDRLPGKVQDALHDILDQPDPQAAQDQQLGNKVWPMVVAELRYPVELSERTQLIPFVAGKSGDEDLLTAGADLVFNAGHGELWLRDDVLGRLYLGLGDTYARATRFGLGADVSHVGHSDLFPGETIAAEETRYRLRAFISHGWGWGHISYGATWLSKEFTTQPEGQVVGDLRVDIRF
ncbi:DUF2219 family protein [Thioclava litoralis]|uniref:DUF2219 family protein n=1 Tax=Thioclava litoralis TaxID=3076557 RepID=A0ABZ1DYA7_9RHOB|nr:DUF2219 family protein [Thioclava sp. FTW29]